MIPIGRIHETPSPPNIMKRFFITAASSLLLVMHAGVVSAQQTRIEAIVVPNEGNPQRIWINEVTRTGVRYYATETTTALGDFALSQARAIFFPEPSALSTAIQQFRGREYRTAMQGFARVAADYQAVRPLANNPSTRAAYFEIECLRLLGEYEQMSEKLGALNQSSLTRENELRQLELNLLWEAVGRGAWDRLEGLVNERTGTRMPGNQRAQVAYCAGVVHEQKGETEEAMIAYNEAMIVDAAASEVVARMAAVGILRILDSDSEVRAARDAWGTENQRPNSDGHAKLLEAGAVARIYDSFVGAGAPLPDAYKPYLEYQAQAPESES